MKQYAILLLMLFPFLSFRNNSSSKPQESSMYFPPVNSTAWDTISVSSLGWNENAVQPLLDYLQQKHTKAFIILVNGKIVIEEYFNGQKPTDTWEWNSAGKTLVSAAVGIAQQERLLNIDDKVSKYLGRRWSREPVAKENLITIRNLMTMTSGLNDERELIRRFNLTYLADAGTRWSYSNVFQLLMQVVENASGQKFEDYFNSRVAGKIGMNGYWNNGIIFRVYHSDARSMARFGLLALNIGDWDGKQIIGESYFKQSITSSQNINPSYGWLWWLNGESSFMVPGSQKHYQGSLIPNAPANMYTAMGAKDQRIYIVPDKKMVVVRMGGPSDPLHPAFALSGFDQALWEKINALTN